MIAETNKTVYIRYFALLREERGMSDETVKTTAQTPSELYAQLCNRHSFSMPTGILRVAINDTFKPWDTPLKDQDRIVFIPPVAGG